MNWWPWQSTQLPSRTSANAAAPIGATRDPYLSAPIDDMTLLAAHGNKAVADATAGAQPNIFLKPPSFVQKGTWEWQSFETRDYAEQTVIRVRDGKCYQHLIVLDWGEFGVTEAEGRQNLEALCAFICAAVNFYRAK